MNYNVTYSPPTHQILGLIDDELVACSDVNGSLSDELNNMIEEQVLSLIKIGTEETLKEAFCILEESNITQKDGLYEIVMSAVEGENGLEEFAAKFENMAHGNAKHTLDYDGSLDMSPACN